MAFGTTKTSIRTTAHISLRASSTMDLIDDTIISPPVSPIRQPSPILHHNTNYVSIAPSRRLQNQVQLFSLH
jgi:hypothetical protein